MMKSVNKFRLLSEKELNRVYGGIMGCLDGIKINIPM